MPRYIFPASTVSNTTGAAVALTFYTTSATGRRETDLWTVSGSDLLERIPNGIILAAVTTGAYSAFAGPDDIDTLYVSVNGGSRTAITATSIVTGQGRTYLDGTYGKVWTSPAASATLTGTLAAWVITSVDCTAGAGARALPAASSVTAGTAVGAKKADTSVNSLVVSRAGSDLIYGTGAGTTSKTLSLAGEAVEFVSNGVDKWTIRSSDTPSGVLNSTYATIAGLNTAGTAPQYTTPLPGVRTPAAATTQHVLDSLPDGGQPPWVVIPPASLFAASSTATWYTANAVTAMRFTLNRTRTFRYVNLYVGVSSGNIQVGVLRNRPATGTTSLDGDRVIDSGVIACPSGTAVARIDLGYFTLTPGDYSLFLWCDNTTATFMHGLATGITASRLTYSNTGLGSGVGAGFITMSVTTRWVSGFTLEAPTLPTSLLGDSITANDTAAPGGTGSWWSAADQDTGYRFYPATNNGVAGENSTQILARAAAAFSGKRYATVLAGTNDIGQAVGSATIISNLQAIYAAAVSAGLQSFAACTITPRVGTGGAGTSLTAQQKTDLKAVNAWIRSNYSTYAGAVLVDWSWALSDGTDETTPLLANFLDGTHPNATGRDIMKSILKKAITGWA